MKAKDLRPEDGLLTPDEETLLKSFSRSKAWRLLRDALCLERELLFAGNSAIAGLAGQPETNQALWANRGAILLIQHLLQEGPRLVIVYERYMEEQREQKATTREKGTVKRPERVYTPDLSLQEPDNFDL